MATTTLRKQGGSSSSSTSSKLSMKLLVDSKSQRVVYAEAGKDVVDFLLNLLTLPIGTVVKLLTPQSMVGSAGNLYRSVEKLDNDYICHHDAKAAKDALLRPTGGCHTGKLLLQTDASSSSTSNGSSSTNRGGFVKKTVTYAIRDNLKIAPTSTISTIDIVNTFGVRDFGCLREKIVRIGHHEALQILKASLESKTVLTDVFLARKTLRKD